MSNPRYIPRDLLVDPRDFGRRENPAWLTVDDSWTTQRQAQLVAAQLQHRVAYGILAKYMRSSSTKTISSMAEVLEVKYDRLQKLLIGASVLQLEDLGRLRQLVGPELELWLLSPESSATVERWRNAAAQFGRIARQHANRRG